MFATSPHQASNVVKTELEGTRVPQVVFKRRRVKIPQGKRPGHLTSLVLVPRELEVTARERDRLPLLSVAPVAGRASEEAQMTVFDDQLPRLAANKAKPDTRHCGCWFVLAMESLVMTDPIDVACTARCVVCPSACGPTNGWCEQVIHRDRLPHPEPFCDEFPCPRPKKKVCGYRDHCHEKSETYQHPLPHVASPHSQCPN